MKASAAAEAAAEKEAKDKARATRRAAKEAEADTTKLLEEEDVAVRFTILVPH